MLEVTNPRLNPLDTPLGRRIGVIGAGGKSTLARALAYKHNLEFIEIDSIQHLPGWQKRSYEEVARIVTEKMASSPAGWVTDHNSTLISIIFEKADTVIVLQPQFRYMLWRRMKRSLKNAWTGELVCNGNRETFRQHLFSKQSAIYEMWTLRHRYRNYVDLLNREAPPTINLIILDSARKIEQFYEAHGLTR